MYNINMTFPPLMLHMKKMFIVLLSVSLLALGYYLVTSPSDDQKDQIECEKYGIEKYGEEFETQDLTVITREYRYIPKLHTCIAFIQTVDTDFVDTGTIWNAYASEKLFSYDSSCEGENCTKAIDYGLERYQLIAE